jgi:hypothetical protein
MTYRHFGYLFLAASVSAFIVSALSLMGLPVVNLGDESSQDFSALLMLVSFFCFIFGIELASTKRFQTLCGKVTKVSHQATVVGGIAPSSFHLKVLLNFEYREEGQTRSLVLIEEIQPKKCKADDIDRIVGERREFYNSFPSLRFNVLSSWMNGNQIEGHTAAVS